MSEDTSGHILVVRSKDLRTLSATPGLIYASVLKDGKIVHEKAALETSPVDHVSARRPQAWRPQVDKLRGACVS